MKNLLRLVAKATDHAWRDPVYGAIHRWAVRHLDKRMLLP